MLIHLIIPSRTDLATRCKRNVRLFANRKNCNLKYINLGKEPILVLRSSVYSYPFLNEPADQRNVLLPNRQRFPSMIVSYASKANIERTRTSDPPEV